VSSFDSTGHHTVIDKRSRAVLSLVRKTLDVKCTATISGAPYALRPLRLKKKGTARNPVKIRAVISRISLLIPVAVAISISPLSSAQSSNDPAAQTGKAMAGKKIFYQRCSVCHLTPLRSRSTEGKAYGPQLKGFVHDAESEHLAMETIRKGAGGTMPGFQYGLRPDEIDDVIAYLKTYR
jgi:mono/diheme cytochrome c family protein